MSIYRISTNTIPDNGVFHMKNREFNMDKVNNQLSTGKKYRLPREGTTEIPKAMPLHTKLQNISQYIKKPCERFSLRLYYSFLTEHNTIFFT